MNATQRYQEWLERFSQDEQTHKELLAIGGDEKEIEDRFYCDLSFGTAGMRGVLGAGTNRMNHYNIRRATLGLADYILSVPGGAERGVAIAYDSRRFSPEFAKEAALTLCSMGVRAMLFDSLRPVPVLSFTVRHLHAIAGIVITASHNPPQYNGYKVYWEDGGQMPPERADAVMHCIAGHGYDDAHPMSEDEAIKKGLLTIIGSEVDDAYISRVRGLCIQSELAWEMGDKLRIVYSPLNGSGNVPVRRILSEIGMKNVFIVPEQELPDPDFTTVGSPNPENLAAYRLARKLAEEKNADLVFATDPDCDRLGCLVRSDQGEFQVLSGNQIACLLLDYVLSGRKAQGNLPNNGAIVKSIVSTEMANAIADSFGVKTVDVLTGFKFIAEQIQRFEDTGEHTFLFGFEESYGYLSGTFVRDKDAVNASMLLSEAAAYHLKEGRTLYQAMQALYRKYGYFVDITESFTLEGKDGLERMRKTMQMLRANPPKQIAGIPVSAVRDYWTGTITGADNTQRKTGLTQSDVLYYELGKDWICVRPSGTEPKIKVYAGAKGETEQAAVQRCKALLDELKRTMA